MDKKAGDLHATFDVEDDLVVFERVSVGWALGAELGEEGRAKDGAGEEPEWCGLSLVAECDLCVRAGVKR